MTRNGWSKNEFNDKISFDNLLSFHEEEERGWMIFSFYLSYILHHKSYIRNSRCRPYGAWIFRCI